MLWVSGDSAWETIQWPHLHGVLLYPSKFQESIVLFVTKFQYTSLVTGKINKEKKDVNIY